MKNIFFFILGILFMGMISVYPTTKEKFCKTTMVRKLYNKGRLIKVSEWKTGFHQSGFNTMIIDNGSKVIETDSVSYEIVYK